MKEIPQKVDIPGYEGVYYVTIDGEVYRYGKSIPLKKHCDNRNYRVNLSLGGKTTPKSMGTIMKMCYFKGTSQKLKHKGSRDDFSYWNLVPASQSEIVTGINKSRRRKVIRILDEKETFYNSVDECAKTNFIDKSTICRYCNKQRKSTIDGATYMWEEDYDYDKQHNYNPTRKRQDERKVRI